MKISNEIKEIAKEIHDAEHRFVDGKVDKKHKKEDYYYLLGSIVFKKVMDRVEEAEICVFNKVVDLQNEVRDLSKQMKELSKQQKYLWQTLEDANRDK